MPKTHPPPGDDLISGWYAANANPAILLAWSSTCCGGLSPRSAHPLIVIIDPEGALQQERKLQPRSICLGCQQYII